MRAGRQLTEDPSVSVLVLEAGPHYRGLPIQIPAALGGLYEKGGFHWDYKSQPERFAGGKVSPYKMGRVVGGSSAINGLVWVRGNAMDYDDWEASGCPGWSFKSLEPIFRRIEAYEDRTEGYMGHDGPIPVTVGRPDRQPLTKAFMAAAEQAGERINQNYNGAQQDGFCALHRNTRAGRRGDVYQGYIQPAKDRPNLKILSGEPVRKLLFDGKHVIGVEAGSEGKPRHALANREVLLCAGAIASPQLLEVSGVGNGDILSRAGITPVHALPGVGENFHTHPAITLSYSCKRPVSILNATRGLGKLAAGLRWMVTKTGPAATNHFEAGAFIRANPEADRPDCLLVFLALALSGTTGAINRHGFQIYVDLIGCKSRGQTHVVANHISRQPEFYFNFLQDPRDVEAFEPLNRNRSENRRATGLRRAGRRRVTARPQRALRRAVGKLDSWPYQHEPSSRRLVQDGP